MFLPAGFQVTDWPRVQPWFQRLGDWEIEEVSELLSWFAAVNELQSVLQEELGWRYIRMTCQTDNSAAAQAYKDYLEQIAPNVLPWEHQLQEKLLAAPSHQELDPERFRIILRACENQVTLFRTDNVPLFSQIGVTAQQYSTRVGAMTVLLDGQTLTLPQAAKYLEDPDRSLRETAWHRIAERRQQEAIELDNLFEELLTLRQQLAQNAGFETYTDFRFRELGRFDFGRAECLAFHRAIEEAVVPFVDSLHRLRARQLGVDTLRPWDLAVDYRGSDPLLPFATADELLAKATSLLSDLHPVIGDSLPTLARMGHLDLASRVGKAPGGYNYPLHETGVPFIFMNAVGTQRDLTTLIHEAGHALHSLLTRELPYVQDRDTPSEVAELASMSLELLSMEGWSRFYPDPVQERRAQLQQIVETISLLPWIATVDAFQFWLYDHPGHTQAQRKAAWLDTYRRFRGSIVDYSGLEAHEAYHWQRQLHLYEVPFYYIEYGIAQLGALQVWRNYLADRSAGVEGYLRALRLGYTVPVQEVYAAAQISFDFGSGMLTDLMDFVQKQLSDRGFFDQCPPC